MFIYPPEDVGLDPAKARNLASDKDLDTEARRWRDAFAALGKGYLVKVCLRAKPDDVRTFDLDPDKPGSLNNARALLLGRWRLATAEEVKAAGDAEHANRYTKARKHADRARWVAEQALANKASTDELEILRGKTPILPPKPDPKASTPTAGATAAAPAVEPPAPEAPKQEPETPEAPANGGEGEAPPEPPAEGGKKAPASKPKASKKPKAAKTIKTGE